MSSAMCRVCTCDICGATAVGPAYADGSCPGNKSVPDGWRVGWWKEWHHACPNCGPLFDTYAKQRADHAQRRAEAVKPMYDLLRSEWSRLEQPVREWDAANPTPVAPWKDPTR